MGDRPERLGEPPGRLGVRRVALVEQRIADADAGRREVRVQVGEAGAGDETLVDERPARRRRDRDHVAEPGGSGGGLDPAADEDEPSLECGVGQGCSAGVERATDERLDERRPARPGRATERDGSVGTVRQRATSRPSAARRSATSAPGAAAAAAGAGSRQEELDDGGSLGGETGAGHERLDDGRIERDRHAGAVRRGAVGPERAAMGERGEPAERERQDLGPASGRRRRRRTRSRRHRARTPGRRGARSASRRVGRGRVGRCGGSMDIRWDSVGMGAEVEPTAREEPGGRS